MDTQHLGYEHVYAVLRVDVFHDPAIPIEHKVTVKEVVRSANLAECEVRRLNEVNATKGCHYFWQQTRLFPPRESQGSEESLPGERPT